MVAAVALTGQSVADAAPGDAVPADVTGLVDDLDRSIRGEPTELVPTELPQNRRRQLVRLREQ